MSQRAFGIDIGGSALKGAYVDLEKGELLSEIFRIETPYPATPEAIAGVAAEILKQAQVSEDIPVGICFPAPLPGGKVRFMANLDKEWVGRDVAEVFSNGCGRKIAALNDADAAGLAEAKFGIFKDTPGVTIFTTLGTGIGTAIFLNGKLVPNTELGHLEIDGFDAETRASAAIKDRENLSYPEYAERVQRYYATMEKLFSPDLFVVGGGISANHDQFLPLLNLHTPIVPATLRNTAGIIGAASNAANA